VERLSQQFLKAITLDENSPALAPSMLSACCWERDLHSDDLQIPRIQRMGDSS